MKANNNHGVHEHFVFQSKNKDVLFVLEHSPLVLFVCVSPDYFVCTVHTTNNIKTNIFTISIDYCFCR